MLDLFSGIGGFSVGLERAGMQTVAFCENNPFCRAVLSKHWPEVPVYDDVKTLTANRLAADGIAVDVICGGFPCQDISTAGKGAGLSGERSGLWREYARLIGEIRPRYVIVENVAALLHRGLGDVLGDLAEIGYDAEWHCIPASHIGAPHRRDRIWIVSYCKPNNKGESAFAVNVKASGMQSDMADSRREPAQVSIARGFAAIEISKRAAWWETEPGMGRVVDGIPARMDRLKTLGNAVVPQIPEMIGRAIINAQSA